MTFESYLWPVKIETSDDEIYLLATVRRETNKKKKFPIVITKLFWNDIPNGEDKMTEINITEEHIYGWVHNQLSQNNKKIYHKMNNIFEIA